ncbi:molybdate ABC transporter substrate-binding protein [Subtercola boreus]|uniref:Molybdate ABC transporter substrate-binding protein n=1 Tax=Subtercola boreus TaxID=120213 RepID=A0A3E0W5U2_9MICO|nr:molybdate ABC transporter substrate-binding protein [Subtercola boreus]RFA18217.1 molybdate ABC transporter substrate-binding protein [Subtercola boreus]RFA18609.1 molybdate ABC transporter substrate-binding protein [Subtercola boreus]RFA24690.1 molybdate ABC transporter substrate-binding protein [Subtercola boreus]
MRTTARSFTLLLVAAAVVTGAAACSAGGSSAPGPQASGATSASTPTASRATAPEGTITVFAAASLKATFTQLGTEFETANPGTTVTFSFAGSSDLVTQITGGAPADVFASADTKNMTKLTDARLVSGTPVNFATNVLEIATPPGNPAGVTSFADLANPGVKTVICAPVVPCGAATVTIETATGVTIPAVSEESAVTDVLGKVSSGEADAGLVYVTDVQGAGDAVQGVPFDESGTAVNTYPIAALSATKSAGLAQAFVDYVTGTEGQAVLSAAGFGAP